MQFQAVDNTSNDDLNTCSARTATEEHITDLRENVSVGISDKDIEKEIHLFRAEADKANEEALKKQIEALKNIISDQKKRV